jgi:hypothetical protein
VARQARGHDSVQPERRDAEHAHEQALAVLDGRRHEIRAAGLGGGGGDEQTERLGDYRGR